MNILGLTYRNKIWVHVIRRITLAPRRLLSDGIENERATTHEDNTILKGSDQKERIENEVKKKNATGVIVNRENILNEIVKKFINNGDYRIACTALRRIHISGNDRFIEKLPGDSLRILLNNLKRDIDLAPEKYAWFLHYVIWKTTALSVDDIIYIIKCFVRLKSKNDVYKIVRTNKELIFNERPLAVYDIFDTCVEAEFPIVANYIIENLFDYDIYRKNSAHLATRFFKKVGNKFIKEMIPADFRERHKYGTASHRLKSIIFLNSVIKRSMNFETARALIEFSYEAFYRNNIDLRKYRVEDELPLLIECENILYQYLFTPEREEYDEILVCEAVKKYVEEYKSYKNTTEIKNSRTMHDEMFDKNSSRGINSFSKNYFIAKLLLSFAYSCKTGDSKLAFNSFNLIFDVSYFHNDNNFILACLYHSILPKENKFVIASKILTSNKLEYINNELVIGLSELAVIFETDELLLKILNALESKRFPKLSHYYILTGAAIRKNRLNFVKTHLLRYVGVPIYSYLHTPIYKLDAAVNILKIVDKSSQEVHFTEILSWEHVEENVKYILYTLINDNFHTCAAGFFSMSLDYYPDLIKTISTKVLVDLVKFAALDPGNMISLFTKFTIRSNQHSTKVLSAIEYLVFPLKNAMESAGTNDLNTYTPSMEITLSTSCDLPASDPEDVVNHSDCRADDVYVGNSSDTTALASLNNKSIIFNKRSLPNIADLLVHAISHNILQFAEYIVPMMWYLLKSNFPLLALNFLINIHALIEKGLSSNLNELNNDNSYSKFVLRKHVTEAFILLSESLLKTDDFKSLVILLQVTASFGSLFRVILPSSNSPLSDSIIERIVSFTIKDDNGNLYIDPSYVKLAKKITLVLYDIVKMDLADAKIASNSIEKLMGITKMSTTYSKESALGHSFDEAMHNAIVFLSKNDDINYIINIQKCVTIFLQEKNLELVSKNYTIVDPLSLKLIIMQIINCVISEDDSCRILDNLNYESIARMYLTKDEINNLLRLLVLYKRFNYGFLVIKCIFEKNLSNDINITTDSLTSFIDACILNDYVHVVDEIMKMKKLTNIIDLDSNAFRDIKLKYLVCRHKFSDARRELDRASRDMKKTLRVMYLKYANKTLLSTPENNTEQHENNKLNTSKLSNNHARDPINKTTSFNPPHYLNDLNLMDEYNDCKNKCAGFQDTYNINRSSKIEHFEIFIQTKTTTLDLAAFHKQLSDDNVHLNSVISIPTLIYILRMFLILEQQEAIYIFLKYILLALPFISKSAMWEFLRCFIESRNFKSAYAMACIIYKAGYTVPENAVVNLFNSLLNNGDLLSAWKFFNIVCILSKEKTIHDAKGKKMLIDLYTTALYLRGPHAEKVRSGIEALNSRKGYVLECDLDKEVRSIFLSKSAIKAVHESHMPSTYGIKPYDISRFKRDYVVTRYIISQYDCGIDKVCITDINTALRTIIEIHNSNVENGNNRGLLIYKYYLILLKMYEGGYTDEEYLSGIIGLLCDGNQKDVTYCLLRAGTYLNYNMKNWYVRTLGYFCETQKLKIWNSSMLISIYHKLKRRIPRRLIEYLIFVLSHEFDVIKSLRYILRKRLSIDEDLLYTVYVCHMNNFEIYDGATKLYKRLILVLLNQRNGNFTYKTLEMLMYLCMLSSDAIEAKRLWTLLTAKYHINPSLKCYDFLMEVLMKAGMPQDALKVLYNLIKYSQIPHERYNKTHLMVLIEAEMYEQALDVAMRICNVWRKNGMYFPAPLGPSELTDLLHGLALKRIYRKATDTRSLIYIFGYRKEILRPFWSSLANKLIDENDIDTLNIFVSIIGVNSLGVWGTDTLIRVFLEFLRYGHHSNAEYIIRYINVDRNIRTINPKFLDQAIRAYADFIPCKISLNKMKRILNIMINHVGTLPSRDSIILIIRRHLAINELDHAEYLLGMLYDAKMEIPNDLIVECVYRWIDMNFSERALRLLNYMMSFNFEFNDELFFGLLWANFKIKAKNKTMDILSYLKKNGYTLDMDEVINTLISAAFSGLNSANAYKEWLLKVSPPTNNTAYTKNLAITNLYDTKIPYCKIYKQDLFTYSHADSKSIKMHPVLSTTKNLWKVKNTDMKLDTGIIPPEFFRGRYKEFYESNIHSIVDRRNRKGRIRSVPYTPPYIGKVMTLKRIYSLQK